MQTLLLGAWQNFPKELFALLARAADGKAAVVEELVAGEGFGERPIMGAMRAVGKRQPRSAMRWRVSRSCTGSEGGSW